MPNDLTDGSNSIGLLDLVAGYAEDASLEDGFGRKHFEFWRLSFWHGLHYKTKTPGGVSHEPVWYAPAMSSGAKSRQVITPVITVLGPGRLGSALATSLHQRGLKVRLLVLRPGSKLRRNATVLARKLGARATKLGETPLPPGLVWITVPDDAIATVADQLSRSQSWRGFTVFHSSGALTSDVLEPLRRKGAKVASVHPGMTFVRDSLPTMEGVPFGVEGDPSAVRLARKIIKNIGGTAVTIRKQDKVLYHAFDSFASPLLIALMATLEEVGKAAGIKQSELRKLAGPLLRQTLTNYLDHGAAAAFSGPLIRGDLATIQRHLDELQKLPLALNVYLALARVAVKKLPVQNRAALQRALR